MAPSTKLQTQRHTKEERQRQKYRGSLAVTLYIDGQARCSGKELNIIQGPIL